MIYNELYDLKQYITSTVKVNCDIGERDIDDTQYPIVQILFIEDGTAHYMLPTELTVDLPITLRIVADKESELEVFKIADKLLLNINQFNTHKGHRLEGDISPEYDEDTKTYKIEFLYNLKLLAHDSV